MSDDYSSEAKDAVQSDAEQAAIAREKTALMLRLKFEKIELLGNGGYGRVYRAFDSLSNQLLIAKCPKSLGDIRWPREVFYHKDLNGVAGVPKYLGTFEIKNVSFLFVEYVDGQSLANRYADAKGRKLAPVDPKLAAKVIRDAAKIAHECHKRNLVHRDLSPNNLMIDQSDKVWVIDFGLSLKAGDWRFTGSKASGVGTYGFRSPEQQKYRSEGVELDARADVYSLGQVLCWLLSDKEADYSVLPSVLQEDSEPKEFVFPIGIAPELIDICEKARAEWRDDRFPDAKSFADALDAWLSNGAVDHYVEPWSKRLNGCFGADDETWGEAEILHVYHEVDSRPVVKYEQRHDEAETVELRPSTPELNKWYLDEVEMKVTLNEPHVVLTGEPDWEADDSERLELESRIAFYKELTLWRHLEKNNRSSLPRPLSANVLLFCEEKEELIVHERWKGSATYGVGQKRYWHTFGGGFLPEFGLKSARDDEHDLLLTAIRETLEESQIAPAFAKDAPAIMCREIATNWHQLMVFAKPVSKWELDRANPKTPGKVATAQRWEGSIKTIPFRDLEGKLITANWVPTGRLHILAWLAMGAPMLHPKKKLFGDKTPWEVYQSVTSAILQKQQELKADQ